MEDAASAHVASELPAGTSDDLLMIEEFEARLGKPKRLLSKYPKAELDRVLSDH